MIFFCLIHLLLFSLYYKNIEKVEDEMCIKVIKNNQIVNNLESFLAALVTKIPVFYKSNKLNNKHFGFSNFSKILKKLFTIINIL